MATLTFDTLKFANKLKAAGVPPEHAEAEAAVLSEVLEVLTVAGPGGLGHTVFRTSDITSLTTVKRGTT